MYKLHTHCRACGYAKSGPGGIKSAQTEKLVEVFDLGVQPLANDFCKDGEERAGCAPLKVLYCPRCFLAQLSVVVQPEILYRNYSYVTSPSVTMQQHFEKLIADISKETSGTTVLEIGSNDGRLLALMHGMGFQVLGVDPAENLAAEARRCGVPTQTGFFGEQLSRILPQSDIVIARHVFCHVDDWQDFIRGLESVSHPETLICLETPYVGDLVSKCEFDTIYHEHLSYLNLEAVKHLLADSKLRLYRVVRYDIHGGAILTMLRHKDWPVPPDHKEETNYLAPNLADWEQFGLRAVKQIVDLRGMVQTLRSEGKRIAGLGASAKSTVWINACGFQRKDIEFIADSTPQKHWTKSPGTDIPITDEYSITRELPDYVVLWAWNYREEILERFARERAKGVRFIVPVPQIELV